MLDSIPDDMQAYAVVSASQPVPHTAYVGPRLGRHQHCHLIAETVGGLTDTLETSLHGITNETVRRKSIAVHSGQVSFDPFRVFDDVG